MKRSLMLLFGFLFLLVLVGLVSAALCKGSDGYYRDCGYGSYDYGYGRNYYSYSDWGGDYGYSVRHYNTRDRYDGYWKDGHRGYRRYNIRSSRDDYYRTYHKNYNYNSYDERSYYGENYRNYRDYDRGSIYLGGRGNYRVEKWTYERSYNCPWGWGCVSGHRVGW